MPTYIVSAANGRLSADAKQRIAEEITGFTIRPPVLSLSSLR